MSTSVLRSIVLSLSLLLLVSCTAGGGGGGGGLPDLVLTVAPQALSIGQGGSQSVTVTAVPSAGFDGTLSATVVFSPENDGLSLGPLSDWHVSGAGPVQRSLTLSVAGDVLAGDYTVTISFMVDGDVVAEPSVTFSVTEPDEADPEPGDMEVKIVTGGGFALLLDSHGQLWAWGNNYFGTLTMPVNEEYGSHNHSEVPVRVTGLPEGVRVLDIAASSAAALARLEDGSAWSWGDGPILGRWYTDDRDPVAGPVSFQGEQVLTDIEQIVAGGETAFAWRGNLGLWSWGDNYYFQMGTTEPPAQSTDTPYASLTSLAAADIEQISLGTYHGIARLSDGTTRTWGAGWSRTLGDGIEYTGVEYGSTYSTPDPVTPLLTGEVVDVSAGGGHTLALLDDQTVWSWGYDRWIDELLGHEGNGWSPGQVGITLEEGTNIVDIQAGDIHSLALLDNGTVLAWGGNNSGQLGNDTTTPSMAPVVVDLPLPAVAIFTSADARFSLALLNDDSLWGWGESTFGVLPGWDPDSTEPGNGVVSTPVQVIANIHSIAD